MNPLILFDKKVSEADAYLQLMIEQVSVRNVILKILIFYNWKLIQKVEAKIEAIEDENKKEMVKSLSGLGNVRQSFIVQR